MLKKPLFWEMFSLFVIVAILDRVASIYHLYWSIYEFDSPVHFLGGAAWALLFLWLYFFSGFFNPPKRNLTRFLIVAVVGSLFVAVFWEIFELSLGEAAVQKAEYPYDTMMDITMGFLGAVAACLYSFIREETWINKKKE